MKAHPRGGTRRHLADRVLQRQQFLVAHVLPENPGEGAPRAGMRSRLRERTVLGPGARVGVDGDQRVGERSPDVLLRHDADDAGRLSLIGNHQVDQGVAGILAHRPADLGQRHALVLAEVAVEDRGHHHPVAAARSVPLVLPPRRVGVVHLGLDALAQRRVLQPGDHLLVGAFAHPERQARVEVVRRAGVGILVRGDVEAPRAGRPRCASAPPASCPSSPCRPS